MTYFGDSEPHEDIAIIVLVIAIIIFIALKSNT